MLVKGTPDDIPHFLLKHNLGLSCWQPCCQRLIWAMEGVIMAIFFMASSSIGRVFSPHCGGKWRPFNLWSPSVMTSFLLPVHIAQLPAEAEMRSSKMGTGSGRAAIFHHHHNGGPKSLPILLPMMTKFIPMTTFWVHWGLILKFFLWKVSIVLGKGLVLSKQQVIP